jgi:hypothetical protein
MYKTAKIGKTIHEGPQLEEWAFAPFLDFSLLVKAIMQT